MRMLAGFSYLMPLAVLLGQSSDGHDTVHAQLESLLSVQDPTWNFIMIALGVAFLAGAAHAVTPGHGKAIVAAYLAGSRGTIGDAVYLGTVVTVTHTASVFILGLMALYAAQHFRMERVFTGLSFMSGLLIVAIGGWLLQSRWKAMQSDSSGDGHEHSHWPWDGQHHHHEHTHTHTHTEEHSHEHDHDHSHEHAHSDSHSHDSHHDHHHPMPQAGRGSLLSLGISGGLVPCPEAMAVLLIAFNLNRLTFGLIILVAFSFGLAAVLIAIGIAMVLAGPSLNRFAKYSLVTRILPVGSAVLVMLLGVAILFKTASDSGLLTL